MSAESRKKPASSLKTLSFEESLARLESLIQSMEEGDVPLEKLVLAYEQGSQLLKNCENHLKSAELKISQIKEDGQKPEPFNWENEA